MFSRMTAFGAAAVVTGVATLAFAAPAGATPFSGTPAQIWVQSFQRSGPDAPCIAPKDIDTPWQDNWNPAERAWMPTWEQWPNGGKGGWTCLRLITWAPGEEIF